MHVEQPLVGSGWAISVLAFWLIAGGLPIALVGLVTSAFTRRNGYQWQPGWRTVFQAGFVVQICSFVLTFSSWLMLFVSQSLGLAEGWRWELLALLILSGSIAGGGFAMRAWRELMAAALPESPPSILG